MDNKDYWFISHSSKDIQIVDQIVDILKRCGIPYWKAPEMIPPGSNYAREITKAVGDCCYFMIIISEASQKSIWVEKEVDIAINDRKIILPIRIDNVELSDIYRFYLNNVQMIDVRVERSGALAENVKNMLCSRFLEVTGKTVLKTDGVLEEDKNVIFQKEHNIGAEDKKDGDIKKHALVSDVVHWNGLSEVDERSNALRINKIPLKCEKCAGLLENVDVGTYRCWNCGVDYYDDFHKIRKFLEENGPTPAIIISRRTGVARSTVEYYFNDNVGIRNSGRMIGSTASLATKKITGTWHSNYGKGNLDNRRK